MNCRSIITFCCLSFVSLGIAKGRDQETEIEKAAQKLTLVLLDQKQTSVTFGKIESQSAAGNIGPGLLIELRNSFEKINAKRKSNKQPFVRVADQANNKIQGHFSIDDDPDDINSEISSRMLVLKITIDILKDSDVTFSHSFYSSRVRDIISAGGITSNLKDVDDTREIHSKLRQVLNDSSAGKPTFVKNGTRIKSSSESQQEIEVLTGSPQEKDVYTARAVASVLNGSPVIPITVGELYAIKVYNNADYEVSVKLKIDGIDQFTFSKDRNPKTGKPRFGSWIIAPKSSFVIKGWHLTADKKTKKNLSSFVVTKYGEGISQFVQVDPKKNGVISISFSRSHKPGSGTAKGNAETGFGPPVEQKQTVVKRKIDPEHDFISVRYSK